MNHATHTFETRGPVYRDRNYVVSRKKEIADLINWIERGRYIVISAPRQTGKTTFFKWALEKLAEETQQAYLPIQLDFEIYTDADVEAFYTDLQRQIYREISKNIQSHQSTTGRTLNQFLSNHSIRDHLSFAEFLYQIHIILGKRKVIMMIDEFDGIPRNALQGFLHALRRMYLSSDRERCPYSLGIVGVRSIAQLDYDGQSSPFNIQDDFTLPGFTLASVTEILTQYRDEVGQAFAPEVINKIYQQSGGQPFLVNRFAQILTDEMELPIDETINHEHFKVAYHQILDEPNVHLLNLTASIRRNPAFERILMNICLEEKDIPFNLRDYIISELVSLGILKRNEDGCCEISNPIYRYNIMQTFQSLSYDLESA